MLGKKAGAEVTLIAERVVVTQKFTQLGGVRWGVVGNAVRGVEDGHQAPEC